jgi:hypothetical protein
MCSRLVVHWMEIATQEEGTMKKLLITAMASASILAFPLTAMAQNNDASPTTNMKGPPNVNGYGKDQETGRSSSTGGATSTERNANDRMPSTNDLKGQPNTNDYSK